MAVFECEMDRETKTRPSRQTIVNLPTTLSAPILANDSTFYRSYVRLNHMYPFKNAGQSMPTEFRDFSGIEIFCDFSSFRHVFYLTNSMHRSIFKFLSYHHNPVLSYCLTNCIRQSSFKFLSYELHKISNVCLTTLQGALN